VANAIWIEVYFLSKIFLFKKAGDNTLPAFLCGIVVKVF
jgi:hypothetical protein